MIQPSPRTAQPPSPRRSTRAVWSAHPDVRAVQVGVVATVVIHLILLGTASKIERWISPTDTALVSDSWEAREFQIELTPAESTEETASVKPLEFVEANPNAPVNPPDKAEFVAAQDQQVAQETPTPMGQSDAPAVKGDEAESTAIVSGELVEPVPAVRLPAPTDEQETEAQEAARKEHIPRADTEKIEGDSPDGIGATLTAPVANTSDSTKRVEGVADAKSETGARTGLYFKVDAKNPQKRPTLAPDVVRARRSPLTNREFGTENIGAVAYNAKWSSYGEYLQKLIEAVDTQWHRIVDQSLIYPPAGTRVTVVFRLNAQGDVSEIVTVSGGGRAVQDACLSAILARAPYGPWTEDMIGVLGESQEMTFSFTYN